MSAADKPSYQPGDWVEILGMHYGRGRVLAVDPRGRRVRVRIGDQDWTLKPDQLKPTAPPDPAERPRPVHGLHSTGAVQHQVDLHGMTVEEALLAAEKALDRRWFPVCFSSRSSTATARAGCARPSARCSPATPS